MSVPRDVPIAALEPGTELGPVVFGPLDRAAIVRYAGASGDFNPIHIDEGYARDSGAPTVFAMGMLPAGQLAHALADWFGGPHLLRRYKVRFTTRVWPGDELVCRGRVVSIRALLVSVVLEARRRGSGPPGVDVSEDEVALVGEAEVELPG